MERKEDRKNGSNIDGNHDQRGKGEIGESELRRKVIRTHTDTRKERKKEHCQHPFHLRD